MGFPGRKIISLRKLVSDLRPINILTGEITVEVTGVVGVNLALWYFRYIVSIFLTLHKRLWSMHIIDTNYFFSGDFQGQEGVRIMQP